MPLGALSICQVSNQLSGKLVNVHAPEVIDLLSLEIEDGRPEDDRYVDATAVEYFSIHDLPPWAHGPRRRWYPRLQAVPPSRRAGGALERCYRRGCRWRTGRSDGY